MISSERINNLVQYPLTHPQKRIWYVEKIYPNTSLYNIGGVAKISGKLNFEILQEAINIFIKKNEGVRLRFFEQNGEVSQYISEFERIELDYFDFSTKNDSQEVFARWVQAEFEKPFFIEEDKLYYFALFKISESIGGYLAKFHHIISDGWSTHIGEEQICKLYGQLAQNERVDECIENSYLEYIDREKKYLTSERFIRNKKFWSEKFCELPEAVLDKDSESITGKRKTFYLDEDKSKAIKEFVGRNNFSLNTFFVSLLLLYLNKVTQRKDIVIGTPVLNRSGEKEKNTFGMFTSTMPFRISIQDNSSVLQFMNIVSRELMECYFNQKYPYDILIQDIELKKKGYGDLFQMCVNYYNTKFDNKLGDCAIETMEVYNGNQIYSLQIVIKDWMQDGLLQLDFDYKVEVYTEEEIQMIYRYLNVLIEKVLGDCKQIIKDITLLTEKETKKLLYEFNSTEADYPKNFIIYQLFEQQVERTPQRIAIEFEGKELTYRQLNEKANQLARFLRHSGEIQGRIVGILATHSLEMVIAILGVIKAGGAYLPIDPNYPANRISYMLEDSGTTIILTNSKLNQDIYFKGKIINLENAEIYSGKAHNLDIQSVPEDLVYVIYTSGSTGKPKGAMIGHQALVNYIWWAKKMYVESEEDVFALYSSLAFDLTVTSIFTPLIGGNKTIVYRDDGSEFILYKIMRENKVSIIKLTPSHLWLLKDMDNRNSKVKCFILGGEDLKVGLCAEIYKSFGGHITVFNEYGPTETVVGCMIYKYSFESDTGLSVPIGVPADNVQIYILGKNMELLPTGSTGEIYISGDGLANGYINRPELTRERFPDNPFVTGKRFYKTGDLAKYRDNGIIEYIGRIDHQIKIRGHRIELGEIERCLTNLEMVKKTAVLVRTDENGTQYLCAYVEVSEGFEESRARMSLSKFLPDYMIPTYFVILERLPLTQNGKIDRISLPIPQRRKTIEEYVVFMEDIEAKTAQVICEVLNIKGISRKDRFFYLGGDSIKAIQIASKLKEQGIKIKVKDILTKSFITEIVESSEMDNENVITETEVCEGSIGKTPISAWFFSQKFSNINHYNQSVLLKLKKDISAERIERALGAIIKQHDALRANYDAETGMLLYNRQYLLEKLKIQIFELSAYTTEEQIHKIWMLGEQMKASLDIESNILIKACIFDLGAQGRQLLITIHHLVVDGVSWRIILEDLANLLQMEENNEVLPRKTSSMQKWAEALKIYSNSESLKKEKPFWTAIYNSSFSFPQSFHTGGDLLKDSDTVITSLTEDETAQLLRDANEAYHTETRDLLIVALALCISSLTRKNEIQIELEGHGREEIVSGVDVSRTVGWFTSIYPVTLKMDSEDLAVLVKSIKEQLRKIPNNGLGFGMLKYLSEGFLGVEKKHIRFNYLGEFQINNEIFEVSNQASGLDCSENNSMTSLIDINAIVLERKLQISLGYSRNKFSAQSIAEFMNTYKTQLIKVINHCCDKDETEFTPSDFNMVDIGQADLDNLFG